MKSSRTITILATILAMLVSEYLFHFPSRILHDGGHPPVNISISSDSALSDVLPTAGKLANKTTVYCTAEYSPVCGSDSITYPNSCEASRSRVNIAYSGTCDDRKVSPLYEEVAIPSSGSGVTQTPVTREIVATDSDTTTSDATGATTTVTSPTTQEFSTGSYHIYWNPGLQYGYALPKYTYYQGQGAQNGALHTMAVGLSNTGSTSLAAADVRIYYYRTVPSAPPVGERIDTGNAIVIIDGDTSNPRVANIIETVKASLKAQ